MTLTLPLRPRWPGALVWTVLAMAGSLLGGFLLPSPVFVRLVLGVVAIGLLVALAIRSPRLVLYLLLGWLPMLGLVRRLVSSLGSASPLGDPLLLVAPAVWIVLTVVAIQRGAFRDRTPLATTVLVLTTILTLSAFNPLQGGLTIGLAGVFLVVPPMLAFWVGRTVDHLGARTVVSLVAVWALPAAVYGLVQTFSGFPSWDARWIAESGYRALDVGGTIRAFGSFSSGSEYAGFLAMGIVAWLAMGRGILRLSLILPAVGLLGTALWFESSRGPIVGTAVAAVLVGTAAWGGSPRRALFTVTLLLLALPWLVGAIAPNRFGASAAGGLAAHQVQGLSDPFGRQSTLPTHVSLVIGGIQQALVNPIGQGVGAVTIAAGKYNGNTAGTEADPGNIAVAAGAMGFVAYVLIVIRGLPLAYRVASHRRDTVALAALGILAVTFLQWFNGAQYAVAPLPWLMLGWLDQQSVSNGTLCHKTQAPT